MFLAKRTDIAVEQREIPSFIAELRRLLDEPRGGLQVRGLYRGYFTGPSSSQDCAHISGLFLENVDFVQRLLQFPCLFSS